MQQTSAEPSTSTSTTKRFAIRRYKETDIQAMIGLVKSFITEDRDVDYANYFSGIDISEQKLYKELSARVNDHTFFCEVIVDSNADIVGGLAADLVELYFSFQRVAADRIFYVKPGYSNTEALSELLQRYYLWAKTNNAIEVQLSNSTGFRQRAFGLFAKRNGFQQLSVGFSRRI